MVQKSDMKRYWFNSEDLIKPIDWEYIRSLPESIQDALELYMRGDISFGKASEIARVPYREMDLIRAKARIPIHI
jgi:predicted HTH domain antitoxin